MTSPTGVPPIPEFLIAKAVKIGIPADKVADEWSDYVDWSDEKWPGRAYGGNSWATWCEKAREHYRTLKPEEKKRFEEGVREREVRQKAEREAQDRYQAEAITFPEYCALVEANAGRLEALDATEEKVLAWWRAQDAHGRRIDRQRPMEAFGRFFASLVRDSDRLVRVG